MKITRPPTVRACVCMCACNVSSVQSMCVCVWEKFGFLIVMSTNYANFAFWFYFDFQTKKVERSAEKGEERRSRSFLLAFWHCNTIDKIPDRHRHTSTQTHTHTRKEIFNLRLVYLINLLDICSWILPFVLIKFVLLLQLLLFLL